MVGWNSQLWREPRKCPDCETLNTYELKDVECPVTVGTTTVLVPIKEWVCSQCGNELINSVASDKLSVAYDILKQGDLSDLVPVGTVYRFKGTSAPEP